MSLLFIPPIISWPCSPGPVNPLPENAEREFVEFIQKFAKNNTELLEKRYKQAKGDLVYAAQLMLCDAGLDEHAPKETYFLGATYISGLLAELIAAGVDLPPASKR